jgi:hypothetical protein
MDMIQSAATVAIILGFLLCIATALILAFKSKSETPES